MIWNVSMESELVKSIMQPENIRYVIIATVVVAGTAGYFARDLMERSVDVRNYNSSLRREGQEKANKRNIVEILKKYNLPSVFDKYKYQAR
jgi:hypothetical protein